MRKDIVTKIERIVIGILFAILLLWFMPFINKGIDVQILVLILQISLYI